MKNFLIAFTLGLTWTYPAALAVAESFNGQVVGVSDGDTLKVMESGRAEKVRLARVDCPEKGQAFGTRAKQRTSDLAFGKVVTVHVNSQDKYGRFISEVVLPDGENLNEILVREGMCWWYRYFSQDDVVMPRYEQEARSSGRGLWVDSNPVPPWDFRRKGKHVSVKAKGG